MRAHSLCISLVICLAGCASQREGYMYSPTQPGRGTIVFKGSIEGDSAGQARARLPDGETCEGRYSTVPGRHVTWDEEKLEQIDTELTQAGMALLECHSGHVLRCEFSRGKAGGGMGQCVDGQGRRETIYF